MNLGHYLMETVYVSSPNHRFLDVDAARPEGPNIGENGEHLTISFLSMNRSSLSIKLCESIARHIPGFKGELLVVDNGSAENEILTMKKFLETVPYRWRIVRLDKNYGVAGGRNRMIPEVRTPWIMSLDNDIYLIKNPLPVIQRDIALLGCHFLAPTILDSDAQTTWLHGGNIYLNNIYDALVIGGGSCYLKSIPDEQRSPFLCTFMCGACGVFCCDTFKSLGGYDESMFVGFEDIEFSLRLFRAGLKVGASNVVAFVHDHSKLSSNNDKDYEKTRFARQRLQEAAAYFEAKHGFKVWTVDVDNWISQREKELDIKKETCADVQFSYTPESYLKRNKVIIMVDMVDWALDNVARQLQRHLADEFEIDILPTNDMLHPSIGLLMAKNADLVHFLWRAPLFSILLGEGRDTIARLFGSWEQFRDQIKELPLTFAVPDHLYLSPEELEWSRPCFTNEAVKGYTVSSKKLFEIYSKLPGFPIPNAITHDGVDLELFRPRRLERLAEVGRSRPLRVGWVGNSAFGYWKEDGVKEDLKGFRSVVRTTLNRLRNAGQAVEERFADKQVVKISYDRMPAYYTEIDVLLCVSLTEGTPDPVLEAMACGVPVISTNVGIVPEVFGPLQREFVMEQRSIDSLADLLLRIIKSPELLVNLSRENLCQIQKWDWKLRAESYREFFRTIITASRARCTK